MRIITGYTPGMRFVDEAVVIWHSALADVESAQAEAAVHQHFRNVARFITVADIRRRVADQAGILPPTTDQALEQARAYNRWLDENQGDNWRPSSARRESIPKPPIHPLVLETARKVGWSTLSSSSAWEERRLFAAAYEWRHKEEEQRILSGDLSAEVAAQHRALAEAGS